MEETEEITASTAERLKWDLITSCDGGSEVSASTSSIGNPFPILRERYTTLHQKYLEEAEEYLNRGELTQASEKYWGAFAELVKAIAADEGVELKHHASIGQYVSTRLAKADPEIGDHYSAANALHSNFYENNLDKEMVGRYAEKVREFIQRFRRGELSALTSSE